MKDRILKMLGNGLSASVVAQAVGCDPSYISQLMQDEVFALEVAKLRCMEVEEEIARDNKYDQLEDLLLEKLENILPMLMRPRDILEALTRVNAAKRRATVGQPQDLGQKTTIVQLILPQVAISKFQLNSQGEVIEVGNRPLINLPAAELLKSLENGGDNAPKTLLGPSIKKGAGTVLTEDSV